MGLDTLARVLRRNGGHNAVQLDQNGLKMEMGLSALLKVEDLTHFSYEQAYVTQLTEYRLR